MKNLGFRLYLLFLISWFLHLGNRIPALGVIRFDLILVVALALLSFSTTQGRASERPATDKRLRLLVLYAVLTIPLVEWPGSVVKQGLEMLIKAIVFYYFTIAFVDSEGRLKKFLLFFVGCQLFRVMEPLYLHVTEGYWGSFASMANWEYLDRLSGAPYDTVNPNGLAFIICTVLPFLFFLARVGALQRLAFLVFAPLCVYALMLTGSRTGFLGLLAIALAIVLKSRNPAVNAAIAIGIAVLAFPLLNADMQDRYLSILGKGAKNEGSASGRIEGVTENFEVAMRRPFFGHGLGTSREANANFGTDDKPAHSLYAETAQELGFFGLLILLLLIKSIYDGFNQCRTALSSWQGSPYLTHAVDALQVWLWLNILFSFASYGLTSFEWYLLGGLSVALQRIAGQTGVPPVDRQLDEE
jgi:putative inorganic carbon (hco3(-)) transporter